MQEFNKNEKQRDFSSIKGKIAEINDGEKFCSVTLDVGHERPRQVNLVVKKINFDVTVKDVAVGDRVSVSYYISSRKKNDRWYTMANVLGIEKVKEK